MADDSDVLSLQQTPGIFYTPFSMVKNLSKNKSLLKNMVSRDFKVNYYGHFLGLTAASQLNYIKESCGILAKRKKSTCC